MQLETIISALRARCPGFANRVAGSAQFKVLPEAAALVVPCAYVVPLDDEPGESKAKNAVRKSLVESFAVIVVLSNVADEKGQASASGLDAWRAALWAALLGWRPAERYEGIEYQGGQLLALDRARLWYQFEFGAETEICPADGWQGPALAALPHFDGTTINVDAIDPIADPNQQYPGPDGRIETTFTVPQSGDLPA